MTRGGKFLVSTTMLAVAAGCAQDGKLEIRSTQTPLASMKRPVPQRIAEARGQLALGNVGLALTSFRIANREDPSNTDALVGMALCYDRMGRYDLSRRNYEAALAIAPGNVQLLAALASSLQLQGRTDEAIAVRQEIAARSAAAVALEQEVAEIPAPMRVAPEGQTAPAIAPAPPAPVQSVQVAAAPEAELAPRSWGAAPVDLSVATPETIAVPTAETGRVEVAAEPPASVQPPAPAPAVRTAAVGRSVTIKLPPARPVQQVPAPAAAMPERHFAQAEPRLSMPPIQPVRVDVPAELANTALARPVDEPIQKPSIAEERGPHLERMSMGEIALITVPRPVWRSTTVALTNRSTTVRFVPLRVASANTQPMKVRLLNAARVNRLAARTRSWLMARGWSRMGIGDAETTSSRSSVLYPPGQRALAQNLANQFGFELVENSSVKFVTMVLGSDAARRPALRSTRA